VFAQCGERLAFCGVRGLGELLVFRHRICDERLALLAPWCACRRDGIGRVDIAGVPVELPATQPPDTDREYPHQIEAQWRGDTAHDAVAGIEWTGQRQNAENGTDIREGTDDGQPCRPPGKIPVSQVIAAMATKKAVPANAAGAASKNPAV
jgi:hypothetical protein